MSDPQASASSPGFAAAGPKRWPPVLWIFTGLAIGAGVWGGIASTHPGGPELLPTVNRWLVRAGLPFFWLAFAAAPLVRLWPSDLTRRLVRERRGIGLCWAVIHLTHAAAIIASWGGEGGGVPAVGEIAPGGLGFVLILAMALTSNDASQRALGRGWGRLHRTGIWYLMTLYVLSYLGNVIGAPTLWKAIALSVALGLIGLRVAVWWQGRRVRSPAPPVAAAGG